MLDSLSMTNTYTEFVNRYCFLMAYLFRAHIYDLCSKRVKCLRIKILLKLNSHNRIILRGQKKYRILSRIPWLHFFSKLNNSYQIKLRILPLNARMPWNKFCNLFRGPIVSFTDLTNFQICNDEESTPDWSREARFHGEDRLWECEHTAVQTRNKCERRRGVRQ